MSTYTTTIGIEVHAELNTKSKMFCGCKNDPHAAAPNAHVCPVCMAHPGTLPTVNREAVRKLLLVGTAVEGELADFSEFDRKNYFYPDIPKAYQLSQYQYPFVRGGALAGVALTRIHLEEDTARSQHDQGEGSVVDFNRAGVPLMELVTEPVIHDAKSAAAFARELQLLLRTIGVSEANMERGEFRVEANVSVSQSETLGTKVEVKNLNSFNSVESAIAYETARQIELLESGQKVLQETRGWDEQRQRTYAQRSKESAEDYRYFPDPDIPKYELGKIESFNKSRLTEILPEIPDKIRAKYRDLGLTNDQAEFLLNNPESRIYLNALIELTTDTRLISAATNFLLSDVAGLQQADQSFALDSKTAPKFLSLVEMYVLDQINSRAAKDLLREVVFEGADPNTLANARSLLQKSSVEDLQPLVAEIIAQHPTVIAEFLNGKEAALKFLVGQGMKASGGAANPRLLEELLRAEITKK